MTKIVAQRRSRRHRVDERFVQCSEIRFVGVPDAIAKVVEIVNGGFIRGNQCHEVASRLGPEERRKNAAAVHVKRFVPHACQRLAPDRLKQNLSELRDEMRFDDLLRGACGRFFPTPTTEREVHTIDELLEGIDRSCHLGGAAVDIPENSVKNRFRLRF